MIFLTHLDTRYIGGGRFKLLSHLDVDVGGQVIRAYKGFVTDFASIPQAARWLVTKTEDHIKAAVLHDLLYAKTGKVNLIGPGQRKTNYTRKECDFLFLQAMKQLKVSFWKRHLMHKAVRVGGWYRWNKAKPKATK